MLAYLALVTLDEDPHLTLAALEYHDYQYRTSKDKGTQGVRLITFTTVFKASPQKELGNPACDNRHLTISANVLFIRSARPFNCGVFGGVFWCRIPFSLQ
uniref:Uncharacterized protein n=1 Tax=Helianthus annuus TaxID=4232 RepID=A0A251S4S2_HELAN